ncbi:MAG: HEAT repeat protein [Planctomycetota bacterium]
MSARGHLLLAIGLAGDRGAANSLKELLAAKRLSPALRARTGLALGLLSDATVVPDLLELLKHEDLEVRRGAAQALGFLGDERSALALGKLLGSDEDKLLRRDVAIALGRMADDRAIPWRGVLAMGTNYLVYPKSLTSAERTGALDLH